MIIKNLKDHGEIYVHGVIVDDVESNFIREEDLVGYVFPAKIREELEALKGLPIDLHIASDGGNVAAGLAMFNALAAHDAPVTVYIDAWAASIASYLAFVGDKIVMPSNTFLMIHNPSGGAFGEASYLRSVAEWLEKIRDMLASKYAEFASVSIDEVKKLMDLETWFTAAEAKELFGDKVELVAPNDLEAVACRSAFKKAPSIVGVTAEKPAEAPIASTEASEGSAGIVDPKEEETSPQAISDDNDKEKLAILAAILKTY